MIYKSERHPIADFNISSQFFSFHNKQAIIWALWNGKFGGIFLIYLWINWNVAHQEYTRTSTNEGNTRLNKKLKEWFSKRENGKYGGITLKGNLVRIIPMNGTENIILFFACKATLCYWIGEILGIFVRSLLIFQDNWGMENIFLNTLHIQVLKRKCIPWMKWRVFQIITLKKFTFCFLSGPSAPKWCQFKLLL